MTTTKIQFEVQGMPCCRPSASLKPLGFSISALGKLRFPTAPSSAAHARLKVVIR